LANRCSAFILLLGLVSMGVVLSRIVLRKPSIERPRTVHITVASGKSIANMFDGRKPDAKVRAILAKHATFPACQCDKSSRLGRLGRKLGIVQTVHAESSCLQFPCQACYVSFVEQPCPTGNYGGQSCNGSYDKGFMVGDSGEGFYQAPLTVCGGASGCPCYQASCGNDGC